jgi:hypothetical protein
MWIKKDLIIEPQHNLWWMKTHAMLPTVEHISGDTYRVYFSGRDETNVSHIGYAEVEVADGAMKVLGYNPDPVFSPGERGCFDDNGVTPSCIVGDKLYYIGWNSGTTTYRMSLIMGIATESSSGFERTSRAPLLKRTDREPFGICTAPFVLKEETGYKMWYVSGEGWRDRDTPLYNIKVATSLNGLDWTQTGRVAIDLNPGETALARPCVVKDEYGYHMYFSYKVPAVGYRIGYAHSNDGLDWTRGEHLEVDTSSTSRWDNEMVEYSYVFVHKNFTYMLYNGNNYGATGIGYAVQR